MKKINHHILLSGVAVFLAITSSFSQTNNVQKDSTKTVKKRDSIPSLLYNFRYNQTGNLFLNNPSKYSVIFDKKLNKYIVVEKIGDFKINTPIFMTPEEYKKYRLKRNIKDYFKSKSSAINSNKKGSKEAQKNLLPKYYVNSKFFESIFGGNTVEVIPTGNLTVKLGGIYQNIDNPQLSEKNRSSFVFDFDQQISMSLLANIGERLKVTANYDTQSTFDFQNIIKLEYAPTEDDIIRKIDAGNVSMPIKNSLINGAQSLFGVKTELQFGKTSVTAVLSQQNSESKTVVAEAGATINPFELRATDYDDNRHFFLAQFFRENYENSLKNYPLISSPIQITRIEIWVTNKNSSTENFRSIVAFADIGESNPADLINSNIKATPLDKNIPANRANNLSTLLVEDGEIRDIGSVGKAVEPFIMTQGTDYSVLQNARKLESNEFSFNSHLGFISLNRKLYDGEVLAVAYEYTVVGNSSGTSFKVGEFSNDGIEAPKNIVVKLLRSEIINTKIPTWHLMMKNIYALGVFPLTSDGFRFEVLYRDDKTGVALNTLQEAKTPDISNKPLLDILNLDKLDQSQNKKPDGFFDYVERITVNSNKGLIIFPETEPFGETLLESLTEQSDKDAYVFKELYSNTKSQAKNNYQNKDKFLLKGYAKSKNNGGIPLGAFNVPRGSVRVTAGGRQLVEGVDFVVDYTLGKVQITDPGLQASGVPINVSTENNAIFNQQRKTFMGVEVEHRFSDKFLLGGTVLNVNERPITQKVNFGQEPINNTIFGLNVDYSTEIPLFTKWVNKLPFVDTDVPSNISVKADFAYLLPGSPSEIDIDGQATSYIDDFEASQISIDLLSPRNWFIASTPQNSKSDLGGEEDDLSYNYKRAKLAWYSIDYIFYGGSKPSNIDNNELSRTEVRRVDSSELFPNTDLDVTQSSSVRTLDLAYFPSERGPYNFDTGNDVNADGTFSNPQDRWAGIMRPLTTNDFDQANVEYIQFWLKNPYENYSMTKAEGYLGLPNNPPNQVDSKLYFNLGNISEDILKDNRKMYENGLPADGIKTDLNTNESIWGRQPKKQSILYTFDVNNDARANQDVGLDGLTDAEEKIKFPQLATLSDPSSDNFQYFRGSALDNANASIISRYKSFNNTEGNSLTASQSKESYPTSSSSYPDVEDINKDQTMNTVENYYEYKVSLNKGNLVKGKNNIVDIKKTSATLTNGDKTTTTWYQFRIPIRSGTPIGISNFNSIRFIRMFVTGFKIPVVLRFGQLELVRGDYRRYTKILDPLDPKYAEELSDLEKGKFEVGVVNIEQNEGRYVVPPGIEREQLQGLATVRYQNEQSVSLKVTDLPAKKTRAIYKNVSVDLRRYKRLKMFIHAEGDDITTKDSLTAIIRLGTDLDDNFYQMEVPLNISNKKDNSPTNVWPTKNNLDAVLDDLVNIKLKRDTQIRLGNKDVAINKLYKPKIEHFSKKERKNKDFEKDFEEKFGRIKIKGNPTLADIGTLMLGVKNNSSTKKSAEIWFNELRSSGFDNEGGWAAVLSADANFADIADVSVTGKIQTIGFGNVEDRVSQRSIEETKQYNVSTSISLGKMMPKKWGIQLPMSYSIGEEFKDPKYDVQYQDVKFDDAKKVNPNSKNAQDYTLRKSISFTNIKRNRNPESKRKPKLYDIENLFVSYSFAEEFHKDYNIEKYLNQNLTASAGYSFAFQSKFIEPFKESEFFGKSKHWQLIKDININLLPKSIGVNSRITRSYTQQKSRNLIEGLSAQPTLTQRRFLFDWDYNISFDLTKSLKLQFNASNSYIYDGFETTEDIGIFNQFFNTGRPDHYTQKLNATYRVPIDKIPFLSFITADYGYTANFDWKSASPTYAEETGNLLQNSNTHNINTAFSFDKLYREIGLKKLSDKKRNKKKKSISQKIILGVYDVITSVKNAKLSYSENNGTLLPGYIGGAGFLGRDNINGGFAPTLGFVFGSQVDIRNKALINGWLVKPASTGEYFSKTYSTTHYNKLDYTVSVKPFKDLDIDIQGNKIQTKNISQQLDVANIANTPISETGNFSMSYFMLFTAFKNGDDLFQKLKDNRSIIANRLVTIERPDAAKFGSQKVLLPAFLATYSGSSPNSIGLGAFKNVPIPNWTLRYNGFMKMDWFKKNFTSFAVSNGYKSSYTISNFTNNLKYGQVTNPTTGKYESELLISSASLIDEFSPLIKVEMKMRNSFSFKGEIKKDRTLTLNFDNSTLSEIRGTEFVLGIGYIIKGVGFSTSVVGKRQKFKGNINMRADITLRDNLTMIRAITAVENNQISGGQKLLSIKFVADYKLNRNLTASFYYDHSTSRYAISTSFPRQSINTGLNIIYNLGN